MSTPPDLKTRDPFRLVPALGPLRCGDAGSSHTFHLLGNTPGPLGGNVCDNPKTSRYSFGLPELYVTISCDKDLVLWDYDPKRLLDDEKLNLEFVTLAHRALKAAVNFGLRPKVFEAYRSPEEADRKYAKYKAGQGGRAAPGWQSVHNYGLAMDVWLYDRKNRYITDKSYPGSWLASYKQLAGACSSFVWGESFNDADHFEYHPNWRKPATGKHLTAVRDWAMRAAVANDQLVKYDARAVEALAGGPNAQYDFVPESDINWLPYFWWAAGAKGGNAPPDKYLAAHPPPKQ